MAQQQVRSNNKICHGELRAEQKEHLNRNKRGVHAPTWNGIRPKSERIRRLIPTDQLSFLSFT